jgi:malate dehydrogenase (quinone)
MVPSLGVTLSDEPALFEELHAWTTKALRLGPDFPSSRQAAPRSASLAGG